MLIVSTPHPVHFLAQPNGYTCGTASLIVAARSLGIQTPDLLTLAHNMGTNPITGTTDIEMSRGLSLLGLPVHRYALDPDGGTFYGHDSVSDDDIFHALCYTLSERNLFLWRTLMGAPHWVLVYGFDDTHVHFMCSCSGPQKASRQEVRLYWKPRHYDGFRIPVKTS